eukprot:m.138098 g.138098  ORF g.138098 m.138098 type:complete len:449 (-) comp13993_c1_seq3:719-2065(-)
MATRRTSGEPTSPRRTVSSRGGASRGKVDDLTEENKKLKERVQLLEKQNRELKRSVFELNMRMAALWNPVAESARPVYDIDGALKEHDEASSQASGSQQPSSGGAQQQLELHAELTGHRGAVYAVQYSPNGKVLATCSMDGTARLWDAERVTDTELHILAEHDSGVSDLAWTSDSERLVTGSFDATARVWDVAIGKETYIHAASGVLQSVAAASNDPYVFYAATSSKNLHVVDTRQKAGASVLETDEAISSICVLPNGTVLSGDAKGVLNMWDIRKGKTVDRQVVGGPNAAVAHIAGLAGKHGSSAGGRYLAINSHDNIVRLYDRGGLSKQRSLQLYASATGHTTQNWPIRCSLRRTEDLPHFNRPKDAIGSFPDGGSTTHSIPQLLLAVGSTDGDVRVFDATDTYSVSPLFQQLSGHSGRVYGVHFHPKELALASCSQDGTARIWTV